MSHKQHSAAEVQSKMIGRDLYLSHVVGLPHKVVDYTELQSLRLLKAKMMGFIYPINHGGSLAAT
jgi:hypothetical protein